MRRVESVETSAAKLGRPAQHGTAGAMAGLTRVYQNRAAHSQVACHWSLARGHGDSVTMEHGTRMLVYTLSTSPAPCLPAGCLAKYVTKWCCLFTMASQPIGAAPWSFSSQ